MASARKNAVGVKITQAQKAKFMASLATWGLREVACQESGIGLSMVSRLIEQDADFAVAYEEAKSMAIASLAREGIRRGRDGWEEPIITRQGPVMIDDPKSPGTKIVATRRVFDPKLLTFCLAAMDPARFGPYAGQSPQALPADMQPDPEPKPDEELPPGGIIDPQPKGA